MENTGFEEDIKANQAIVDDIKGMYKEAKERLLEVKIHGKCVHITRYTKRALVDLAKEENPGAIILDGLLDKIKTHPAVEEGRFHVSQPLMEGYVGLVPEDTEGPLHEVEEGQDVIFSVTGFDIISLPDKPKVGVRILAKVHGEGTDCEHIVPKDGAGDVMSAITTTPLESD